MFTRENHGSHDLGKHISTVHNPALLRRSHPGALGVVLLEAQIGLDIYHDVLPTWSLVAPLREEKKFSVGANLGRLSFIFLRRAKKSHAPNRLLEGHKEEGDLSREDIIAVPL